MQVCTHVCVYVYIKMCVRIYKSVCMYIYKHIRYASVYIQISFPSNTSSPGKVQAEGAGPKEGGPVSAAGCRLAGGTPGLGTWWSHCWGVRSSMPLQPTLSGRRHAACCAGGSPGRRLLGAGVSSVPRCSLQRQPHISSAAAALKPLSPLLVSG